MKNLIIIGARGFGREAFNLATRCSEFNNEWVIKGFLDDNKEALDGFEGYPPIIGPVETYDVKPGDLFVCALGSVKHKYHYVKIIKDKGGIFTSLIHPSVLISRNTKFGEGFMAWPFTAISCDIEIGDFVTIQSFSDFGHDVKIGNYCHINAYSFLGGFVKVGNFTTIHTGARIIPNIKIGDNATVGAGSIVIKNVADNCTVFGNPAKVIFME
jgi:sugar O-acyltransferase (sialic acid O-acetyltransferase NeuD family)